MTLLTVIGLAFVVLLAAITELGHRMRLQAREERARPQTYGYHPNASPRVLR